MKAIDILSEWMEDEIHPLIIQLFVEESGKFNYTYFNQYWETKFTHAEINSAIEDLTGSKVVRFKELDTDKDTFEDFKQIYKFGEYENARGWISQMYVKSGKVLPRSAMLNWIATQHPPKQHNSFLPSHDGNMYVKEEKETEAA